MDCSIRYRSLTFFSQRHYPLQKSIFYAFEGTAIDVLQSLLFFIILAFAAVVNVNILKKVYWFSLSQNALIFFLLSYNVTTMCWTVTTKRKWWDLLLCIAVSKFILLNQAESFLLNCVILSKSCSLRTMDFDRRGTLETYIMKLLSQHVGYVCIYVYILFICVYNIFLNERQDFLSCSSVKCIIICWNVFMYSRLSLNSYEKNKTKTKCNGGKKGGAKTIDCQSNRERCPLLRSHFISSTGGIT